MPDITARGGYEKPFPSEDRAVEPLNRNTDKTAKWIGAFTVDNGATIPDADRIDGMLVHERTSGYFYDYRRNTGTGLYEKKFLHYPWQLTMIHTGGQNVIGSGAFENQGYNTTVSVQSFNNSAGDVSGLGQPQVPVRGLYSLIASARWVVNGTGIRHMKPALNQSAIPETLGLETVEKNGDPANLVYLRGSWNLFAQAGDDIGVQLAQTSGIALGQFGYICVTLICPVD